MRSIVTLALLALTGCAAGEAADERFTARDSAGIRIAESKAPQWQDSAGWRLAAQPSLSVGVVEGPVDQQLFRVVDAVRRPDGSVLIANGGTFQVRLYDPAGALSWAAGGEGDGPGEFRALGSITLLAGDSVEAFDPRLVRQNVYEPDGLLGRVQTFTRASGSGQHNLVGRRANGDLVVRLGWSSANDPPDVATGRRRLQDQFFRYAADGTLDTLGTFAGSEQMTVIVEDGRSFGVAPFGWGRVEALRGDELVIAYTERFEVLVLGEDGAVRQILRAPIAPDPVTQEEKDAYLQEARERLREGPPPNPIVVRMSEIRLEVTTFPPTHPVLDQLLADDAGNLWVRHARRADVAGPFEWSVFDPEGRWLGKLQMPGTFRPMDIGADYVLGVTTDELGVEYAHVYPILKP